MQSIKASALTLGRLVPLVALALMSSGADAQRGGGTFTGLSGAWSGTGTISLSSGANERIRCRSTYAVPDSAESLQLNLRCASDSYRFDLSSNVMSQGGSISGTWSEATRGVSGNISGRASTGLIQARVDAPGFAANLTLNTRGDRQSVSIASQGTELSGVAITLTRGR